MNFNVYSVSCINLTVAVETVKFTMPISSHNVIIYTC